ncbi:hypothetical protein C2E23DRAFT_850221, partial [Lenzites betulinus]
LKSYRTNNHEGGDIETTFFREFHRSAQLHRAMTHGLLDRSGTSVSTACKLMMDATSDNRGTLQQLTQDLDDQHEDANISILLSPRSSHGPLPASLYFEVLAWLNLRHPEQPFHSDVAIISNPLSIRLRNAANVFDYVVLSGHRYHASSRAASNVNSLALCRVSGAGATCVGELQHIVHYEDVSSGVREVFAAVKWLQRANITLVQTPWGISEDVFSLQLWDVDQYLDRSHGNCPEQLVALADILSPVACHTVDLEGQVYWLTMPLARAVTYSLIYLLSLIA